jgi:hypothetical protein
MMLFDRALVQVFESRNSVVFVDVCQQAFVGHVYSFAFRNWLQSISEFLTVGEQITSCCIEVYLSILSNSVLTPGFFG